MKLDMDVDCMRSENVAHEIKTDLSYGRTMKFL
ncbi:hypothetical protein PUN4_70049 [Paraburkholderia unamae]|nr:hypothetical protein PUN4_70049 [Paraburkholderia unamae]